MKPVVHTRNIFPGDTVRISCQGIVAVGVASTVGHDWSSDAYSIEMTDQDGSYRYWKQASDGGGVELVAKAQA